MNYLIERLTYDLLDYIKEADRNNYDHNIMKMDIQKMLVYFYSDVRNKTIAELESQARRGE